MLNFTMFMANSIHSKIYVLRMQGKNEQKVKGAASGLGKVALCCISLPYRHRLSPLLLHFSSASLRMAWKKQREGNQGPSILVKDRDEAPSSWLYPGSVLAAVVSWEVNQQMKDSLSLLL